MYKTQKSIPIPNQLHPNKNKNNQMTIPQINMVTLDGKPYNGSNYFNANYIISQSGNVDFIATKHPIQQTLEDFWNVVLINGVSSIVGKHIL